jgi:hypothetical protein
LAGFLLSANNSNCQCHTGFHMKHDKKCLLNKI